MQAAKKTVGLIVNPIAGIGGKVGLKGSDGPQTLQKALERGASLESGVKASITLEALTPIADHLNIYTYPGEMGADLCTSAGLPCTVLGKITKGHTTPSDTANAAQALMAQHPSLILFAGGDGTARNMMDVVGTSCPVLGIPTGCKIHSGVYATNPRTAGTLARQFLQDQIPHTKKAEVMDIDEDLFRQNKVQAKLYGYLLVPDESSMMQNLKSGSNGSENDQIDLLAAYMTDTWEDDTLYIVGTGSTTAAVMKQLHLTDTLLGVDLVFNRTVIASDCSEQKIWETIQNYDKVKILVTVIGGQGYVFGRGNQQISARVIRKVGKENILIIASKNKILSLNGNPLLVDTGEEQTDQYLTGYTRVTVGYGEQIMARIAC